MSVFLNPENIAAEIATITTSMNSTSPDSLDVITPKVLAILNSAEKIPENASIKGLLVDLEASLKSKKFHALGERVHQFTLSHLAGDHPTFPLNEETKGSYTTSRHFYTSDDLEKFIHSDLAKRSEPFGLTDDQLFEIATLIVEKHPEHLDFLFNNLNRFGLSQMMTIKGTEGVKRLSITELNEITKKITERVPIDVISKTPGLEFKEYEAKGLPSEKRAAILKLIAQKHPGSISLENFAEMSVIRVGFCIENKPDYNCFAYGFVFTKEEFAELAIHFGPPLLRAIAFFANVTSLNQDQAFALAKGLMKNDPDGFDINSPNPFNFLEDIPKIEIHDKEKLSELLAIGVVNHPISIPPADFSAMFNPAEETKVMENRPELFLFFDPKTATQKQLSLAYPPFNQRLENIREREEPEKSTLIKWLGYVEACRKSLGISDIGEGGEAFLDAIQALRSPVLKYKMTQYLFTILTNQTLKSTFESEKIKALFSGRFSPLFHLLLIPMIARNPNQKIFSVIANILNSKYYKDAPRARIAMTSLLAIEDSSLTDVEKIKVLKMIFGDKIEEKPSYASINKNLQLVEAFINLKHSDKFKKVETIEDIELILRNTFIKATGIEALPNFSEKYLRSFGSFRQPEAILIYAGKLRKELSSQDLISLKMYVESVLNGQFFSLRYEENPHLSIVFKGRQGLKELWMKGSYQNLEEYMSAGEPTEVNLTSQPFDVRTFLYERVCRDHHISPKEFGYLARCLEDPERINEESISLVEALKTEKNQIELQKLRLQKGLLALLDTGKSDAEKNIIFNTSIAKLIETVFPEKEQFKYDLRDLKAAFNEKKTGKNDSVTGWTIVDTDDPQDMLMCGTEVPGSCQSINATAYFNKCLLGYALDGKNRLVAVKNENGEIVARAILRILWDETEKTPVLFRERLYSRPGLDPRIPSALNQFFEDRSKVLQLPLASESKPHAHPLRSFGNRAGFEYVDAKETGMTNGEYVI